MVDRALLFEQLMVTFIDELEEHVRTVNDDLLILEKNPSAEDHSEALKRLFRSAHTIKGASRAVEQRPLEQLCHELEEVLTAIRDKKITPTADTFSVLFSVVDAIESAGMQLRERSILDTDALDVLMDKLRQAAAGTYVASQPGNKIKPIDQVETAKPTEVADAQPELEPGPETQPQPAKQPVPTVAEPPGEEVPRSVVKRSSLAGSVRVGEEKLDSLLAQSGELLVARQRVEGRPADLDALTDLVASWKAEWQSVERTLRLLVEQGDDPLLKRSSRLTERAVSVIASNGQNLRLLAKQLDHFKRDLVDDARQLGHASRSLQEDVHRIRMFPFAEACAGLQRAVRDLASSTGKQVELIIEGGDIEMDRAVLESLGDPLLHLVRNAVDHGIESPEDRQAANKKPIGTISVAASLHGAHVDIVVRDDGGGLNLSRIRKKVREMDIPEPADDQQLMRTLFLPGFSTAPIVTDVSGRGIGMDVVKTQVEDLHGTIDISSQPGRGTEFRLSVPLTMTTLAALFVRVGKQTLAVPSSSVRTLTRFPSERLRSAQGRDVLPMGAAPIPVNSLANVIGIQDASSQKRGQQMLGIVLQTGDDQVVFLVDEVLHESEVVIKKLGPRVHRLRFVSGGVLLRSGAVALLLNAPALIKAAKGGGRTSKSVQATTAVKKIATAPRRRLMVVDDSMTTRALLKSILQSAGHEVVAAVDGQDAWQRLQHEDVELVVTDVDMPKMNGIELAKTIRSSGRFRDLPVVLVTSRDSDEDKARGVEAGADAYLVKSAFDQTNILETIDQLL